LHLAYTSLYEELCFIYRAKVGLSALPVIMTLSLVMAFSSSSSSSSSLPIPKCSPSLCQMALLVFTSAILRDAQTLMPLRPALNRSANPVTHTHTHTHTHTQRA